MLEDNLAEDVFPISQAQDSLRAVVQKAGEAQLEAVREGAVVWGRGGEGVAAVVAERAA